MATKKLTTAYRMVYDLTIDKMGHPTSNVSMSMTKLLDLQKQLKMGGSGGDPSLMGAADLAIVKEIEQLEGNRCNMSQLSKLIDAIFTSQQAVDAFKKFRSRDRDD